ncbi:MAG: hypothetical protein IPM26_15240 [Saprospiraceae bacterium]|nr:hypothetical protein [Saprospiraceae bacterium]
MRRFEKHLERAISVAQKLANSPGVIDERMKADISSFGSALLHNGLLPAIALFSDSSSGSGKRRVKLTNAVFYVLESELTLPLYLKHDSTLLLNKAIATPEAQRDHLRNQIMDAAMSLKLAIRTFKLERLSND